MLWHLFKRILNSEIFILIVLVGLCAFTQLIGVTCIIYQLIKVPCPTCGMTRALCNLFVGNLNGYANYNIMALPVALVMVSELFYKRFGRYQKLLHWITFCILVINLVYYIFRLYCYYY